MQRTSPDVPHSPSVRHPPILASQEWLALKGLIPCLGCDNVGYDLDVLCTLFLQVCLHFASADKAQTTVCPVGHVSYTHTFNNQMDP